MKRLWISMYEKDFDMATSSGGMMMQMMGLSTNGTLSWRKSRWG
ncbi:hypothetical protein NST99_32215 [Paenibacillus sp. FSL L8-0470]